MKLQLNDQQDALMINAWTRDADGDSGDRIKLQIADTWYRQSLILTPQSVELWDVEKVSQLTAEHFAQLAAVSSHPEVIILGTGNATAFPPPAITRVLHQKQIGLEVMDTAAACRTYNILASDGRRAVAGLILE